MEAKKAEFRSFLLVDPTKETVRPPGYREVVEISPPSVPILIESTYSVGPSKFADTSVYSIVFSKVVLLDSEVAEPMTFLGLRFEQRRPGRSLDQIQIDDYWGRVKPELNFRTKAPED